LGPLAGRAIETGTILNRPGRVSVRRRHDMNQPIGQGGAMAALPSRGIGEILSAAFQLYRRHWPTLLAIAAVVVVPLTLLQYGIGHWVRTNGQQLHDPARVSTSFWAVAGASLLAAVVALLLYQVLTGAITRTIAAEVAGQDLALEQSYRFGFARLGPVLVVSVLVGLATLLGLIVFIIPGIYIGVRLAVSIQALVVEDRRGTEAMRRSWELVGGHWWHAAFTLLVAALITGVVNALITAPFSAGAWLVQGIAAAVATTVTLPYGALVGVLLYLDLRARKERLDLDTLKANLQASTA
jgi:Membrane domain of glycerophosphoryl diester phosphodiesterase